MQTEAKKATIEHLNIINDILRKSKAYWGYDAKFLDLFIKTFGLTPEYMGKHVIKLFHVDEKLVGFFNFILNNENLYELDNFFLLPEFIGKGIGRKLWISCCAVAIEQGIHEFILWSEPKAEKFYLKMGCEKIGFRESVMIPNLFAPVLSYKIKDAF